MPAVGLEPTNPEGSRFTVCCNCRYAILPKIRKEEDGSVDILFYDRHYLGEYLQTPITPVSIHSRTIDVIIPRSTFVHPIGLEPMTSAM